MRLRDDLISEEPYGAPQLSVPVVLNVNENPFPPSPAVVADMLRSLESSLKTLNRYPDREAMELRAALGSYLGIQPEQIWVANGSNEIMHQLCTAYGGPGRKLLSFSPSYSMYPEYARNTLTEFIASPRRDDFTVDTELVLQAIDRYQPSLVILARPNNPTGTGIALEVIDEICASQQCLIVVDEAYQEFSSAASAVTLLSKHENLVVSRTMSKAFALAGSRIGYLAAAPEIVDACRIVRLPYHLSTQSQVIALVALRHADEMLAQVADLARRAREFEAWLRQRGYEVADSEANFTLFGIFKDRHLVWQQLLDRGVLIRETGPEGYLRASAGTEEEMKTLQFALDEINPERIRL